MGRILTLGARLFLGAAAAIVSGCSQQDLQNWQNKETEIMMGPGQQDWEREWVDFLRGVKKEQKPEKAKLAQTPAAQLPINRAAAQPSKPTEKFYEDLETKAARLAADFANSDANSFQRLYFSNVPGDFRGYFSRNFNIKLKGDNKTLDSISLKDPTAKGIAMLILGDNKQRTNYVCDFSLKPGEDFAKRFAFLGEDSAHFSYLWSDSNLAAISVHTLNNAVEYSLIGRTSAGTGIWMRVCCFSEKPDSTKMLKAYSKILPERDIRAHLEIIRAIERKFLYFEFEKPK